MISAVLFDFGGTLDSDGQHWLDRFYAIYPQVGLHQIPKNLIKEAFYWADEQADLDRAIRTADLQSMMDRHVAWQFKKLGLNDKALETKVSAAFAKPCARTLRRNRHVLEALHFAGLKLGVISNFYGNVEVLCKEFGLNEYLDFILDSMVVGVRKPDPAIFRLALEKLGTPAEETAFVGDSFDRDIIPAKALGMKTIWLLGDRTKVPPDPTRVDEIVHSLEDLPLFLKKETA